jgi:hypothetical protein
MASYELTPDTVMATIDLLADVDDDSDSMTAEQCIEFRVAIEKVKVACNRTLSYLDHQAVKLLDGQPAIIRDGRKFYIGPKTERERFDHQLIQARIIRHVLAFEEGDTGDSRSLLGREDAVRLAVHLMGEMYLSEATRAKKGQIDRLEIPRSQVIEVERGELEVKSVPAGGET